MLGLPTMATFMGSFSSSSIWYSLPSSSSFWSSRSSWLELSVINLSLFSLLFAFSYSLLASSLSSSGSFSIIFSIRVGMPILWIAETGITSSKPSD